jgi:hypothetical protein
MWILYTPSSLHVKYVPLILPTLILRSLSHWHKQMQITDQLYETSQRCHLMALGLAIWLKLMMTCRGWQSSIWKSPQKNTKSWHLKVETIYKVRCLNNNEQVNHHHLVYDLSYQWEIDIQAKITNVIKVMGIQTTSCEKTYKIKSL